MSPSSTSSSDEAPEGLSAPSHEGETAESGAKLSSASRRALLLCLGILLVLEFGAARRDWIWNLDPRRPVGIFQAVENEIIVPAEDIRVVVFGSSVMRDGIVPRAFEAAAGIPEGSVLNTSMPNATPFDFTVLYERNRDAMHSARLLIVGIEDWYFYEEPGISERYHRWATLSDRLADYGGSERLPLIVSWIWKTYAARNAFAFDALGAALSGNRAEVVGDDGRVFWRPEEQAAGPESFDLQGYEERLRERVWRDRPVRYLTRLLELAAEDGLPVVIVRMPMRSAALERRERIDRDAERRLQGAIAAAMAADAEAGFLDFPAGPAAGLEEHHFLDERHLGTEGAEVFTRLLAAWAAENYDLR